MILIYSQDLHKKYSLSQKIDTPPAHSINGVHRVCSETVSLVTQGYILRIVLK